MVCPNCFTHLSEGAAVCPCCGLRISNERLSQSEGVAAEDEPMATAQALSSEEASQEDLLAESPPQQMPQMPPSQTTDSGLLKKILIGIVCVILYAFFGFIITPVAVVVLLGGSYWIARAEQKSHTTFKKVLCVIGFVLGILCFGANVVSLCAGVGDIFRGYGDIVLQQVLLAAVLMGVGVYALCAYYPVVDKSLRVVKFIDKNVGSHLEERILNPKAVPARQANDTGSVSQAPQTQPDTGLTVGIRLGRRKLGIPFLLNTVVLVLCVCSWVYLPGTGSINVTNIFYLPDYDVFGYQFEMAGVLLVCMLGALLATVLGEWIYTGTGRVQVGLAVVQTILFGGGIAVLQKMVTDANEYFGGFGTASMSPVPVIAVVLCLLNAILCRKLTSQSLEQE